MTFLNPAILFGLIAASIPVVLHFLNLRKLKKIEFSTLVFLKELQKTKIRRIKLKQWLLLLLRVLIIACLVLAFARPTVENSSFGSSTAKTTAVIIIDNTFSMSVVSGNGSYLNQAKQTAKSLLNIFQDGDEIALISTGDISNNEIAAKTNIALIKKGIDELEISAAIKTLNEVILQAGQVLYQSKNFNKEIYLLTDLQTGSIFNSQKELTELKELLKGVRIYLIDINKKEAVNVSVDKFELKNQVFEKNKTIGFSALVKNHSANSVNNSIASLFINGKRSAQQSISIPAKDSAALNFESTLTETGIIEAVVELEDDDIIHDNKRYISFNVPDKIDVLIITELKDDSKFIRMAIENFGEDYFKVSETNVSQAASLNFTKYNAVILIGSVTGNSTQMILDFVESGKGLIIMPGSQTTFLSLKNTFNGLKLPEPAAFVGKQNSPETGVAFNKVDFENPLFENLFEEKNKTRIESPDIYYYAKINPGSLGKTIISMYDNSAFLSEYKAGNGKIIVFNSPPVLNSNSFPLKSIFAPLINKTLLYVSSGTSEQKNIFAGTSIPVNIQSISVNQIKIEKPNNVTDYVNTDSISNKRYLNFSNTGLCGTYKFYSNNNLIDYFTVNSNPKESVTEYEPVKGFENYLNDIGFEGGFLSLNPEDDLTRTIYQSRFGIELWKYFLIAALLLALLEMFVAKSAKRDLVND